ncbi:hypothetical protein [Pedobacter sp. JY14-1]|uniref:hypothetical protein n=1 Tax=Pedobacter sp. JY14-1 TaxID=3034151 RepID=UPI0023E13344|nr:hypothetical protein [Pedobacter sp. JY14-1]
MQKPSTSRLLVKSPSFIAGLVLFSILPFASAAQQVKKNKKQQTEVSQPEVRNNIHKPDIKEVPRSRKQLKPASVKAKVKPIKVVRPKIKKP